MSDHPFRYRYIGLGLRDEGSIRGDGDIWTARYPDVMGRPYLSIEITPRGVMLIEVDVSGKPVARTWHTDLGMAIGCHGQSVLSGDPAPFLVRLGNGAGHVFVPFQTYLDYLSVYVPAIAMGSIHVPLPIGASWVPPEPGPLGRRLGFAFDEDRDSPVPSILRRTWATGAGQDERIMVRRLTVPSVLVPELARAIEDAIGPYEGAEWRPYLDVDHAAHPVRHWSRPPEIGDPQGGHVSDYSIYENYDRVPSL